MFLQIQFLDETFLYGLLLLLIPILLHLFHLHRYKKVYFSNFNFLETLELQRRNRSKLKKLLLLLFRLTAVSSIVLAFATPYIASKHKQIPLSAKTKVVIYVDNSFSMSNSGLQGTLLEESKKLAFDIVNHYPHETQFGLLTNESADHILYGKKQITEEISKLKITPNSKSLSQVLKETQEFMEKEAATLYILSDFQKKNVETRQMTTDSTLEITCIMLKPGNKNNIYINGVHFEHAFHQKNHHNKLYISLVNVSALDYHNLPVSLIINGKNKSINPIHLAAHSEKTVDISYLNTEDGFYKGIVEISDFPIIFDNKFYFSYRIQPKTNILYLWQQEKNPYFAKLFSDTTTFHFTAVPILQIPSHSLSNYHLIIADNMTSLNSGLENTLQEYLADGGNLFFIPNTNSSKDLNFFLERLQAPLWTSRDSNTIINYIETETSLFKHAFKQSPKDVTLPHIQYFYPLSTPHGTEKLLTDKRKHTLLATKSYGKGNLYISAFNFQPENSSFVFHPLFIPLMINMASQINSSLNLSYCINKEQTVTIHAPTHHENMPFKIQRDDLSFEFIPEIKKNFNGDLILLNGNYISQAGLYEVLQKENVIDVLAWNYDRTESQMDFCDEDELKQLFPDAQIETSHSTTQKGNYKFIENIVTPNKHTYLTFWFLLSAIIALFAEQWLWKKKLN